ncbi:hypothetical protein PCE1_001247 [Barthelona sp. PCE]
MQKEDKAIKMSIREYITQDESEIEMSVVQKLLKDEITNLKDDFTDIADTHKEYLDTLKKAQSLSASVGKKIKNFKRFSSSTSKLIRNLEEKQLVGDETACKYKNSISSRSYGVNTMKTTLPQQAGRFINFFIGSLNVSLPTEEERFNYREEYEKTRSKVSMFLSVMLFSRILYVFFPFVAILKMFSSTLIDWVICVVEVLFYLSLSFRELILKSNGSRIKLWWITHHLLTALSCALLLTHNDVIFSNDRVRIHVLVFGLLVNVFQQVQFQNSKRALYRKRALGRTNSYLPSTDGTTGEIDKNQTGFFWWLVVSLAFMLQTYQFFVGITCYIENFKLFGFIIFCLALGNSSTTILIVHKKWRKIRAAKRRKMTTKCEDSDSDAESVRSQAFDLTIETNNVNVNDSVLLDTPAAAVNRGAFLSD